MIRELQICPYDLDGARPHGWEDDLSPSTYGDGVGLPAYGDGVVAVGEYLNPPTCRSKMAPITSMKTPPATAPDYIKNYDKTLIPMTTTTTTTTVTSTTTATTSTTTTTTIKAAAAGDASAAVGLWSTPLLSVLISISASAVLMVTLVVPVQL